MHDTITLNDFVDMRKIIDCTGDKRHIVEFVDRYLPYDEYGELSRGEMRDILIFVIGGESSTSDIILKTIWSWLEKNGVIGNEIIRRSNMQLLFERNKIVSYFLISLIFGTNSTSALDLAQEVLL